jgi:hypothetical protein
MTGPARKMPHDGSRRRTGACAGSTTPSSGLGRWVIAATGAVAEDGVMQWALLERDEQGAKHTTLLAKSLLTAAAIVVLVGVGFAVGIMWQPKTQLSNETGKLFLQAVFIVAVGAVVAFFVETVRERRAKQAEDTRKARERKAAEDAARLETAERERDNALITLNEFIDKLDAAYVDVKRIRRVLAAKAKPDLSGSIGRSEYWTDMLDLNEQQIDLEQLAKDADMCAERLPELAAVATAVDAMERYVKTIWDECEDKYASTPDTIPVASLERLAGFLASVHRTAAGQQHLLSTTIGGFTGPYRRARSTLIRAKTDWRVRPAVEVVPGPDASP